VAGPTGPHEGDAEAVWTSSAAACSAAR
jgi:hypothetical protein